MTATVEQIQSEWRRLIDLAQQGEEVVITEKGRIVARLTGVPQPSVVTADSRAAWLAELAKIRESMATGKPGASTDEILNELRSERI